MNRFRTSVAALAAATLVGAPLALVAAPAHADVEKEREFRVAGAEVDFQVEKERRFDVDVDIDDARPGSRWRIVLRHDGKVVHDKVKRADDDGEVDVDLKRRDTAGKDTFKLTVKRVGGAQKSATIRFAR